MNGTDRSRNLGEVERTTLRDANFATFSKIWFKSTRNSAIVKSAPHIVEGSMHKVASVKYILKLRHKGHAIISIKGTVGCRSRALYILTSVLGGGGWSTQHFGSFTPGMGPGAQFMLGWLGSRAGM